MEKTFEFRLLNDFQHDFPLLPEPFAEAARRVGLDERATLDAFERLWQEGKISRIGAILSPGAFGVSTLAAMSVPCEALEEVAARINRFPCVNHNYEREHHINLWFVLAAASQEKLQVLLKEIEQGIGIAPLSLPLLEAFHVDLGFSLDGVSGNCGPTRRKPFPVSGNGVLVTEEDQLLLASLQCGLPFKPRPYLYLAEQSGMTEEGVIARLKNWLDIGAIRRFGVIVRHHALGYAANAMLVFDVPDDEASLIGKALAGQSDVTLCHQRARGGAKWLYNLFCMIHGKNRDEVSANIEELRMRLKLMHFPYAVLFSRRCFKQAGMRYG